MASNTYGPAERPRAPPPPHPPTTDTRDPPQHSTTPTPPAPRRFAQPSSSTAGFFQPTPHIPNQSDDDAALQRALGLFVPAAVRTAIAPSLAHMGAVALSAQVLAWVADAERNAPHLRTWDTWGVRRDELVTSEGWRALQRLGIAEGMVGIPYANAHAQWSRLHHAAKYHLWAGSAAWVNCPSLMSDGVAALLRARLSEPAPAAAMDEATRRALASAYQRLVSCDPDFAWTTGQWMTERQGGSDVSQTETLATYAPERSVEDGDVRATDGERLGPWAINGFKWFSSATDCQMTVFLARTANGVSAFYAPMRRTLPGSASATTEAAAAVASATAATTTTATDSQQAPTELNGVKIQRLKNKLGTRALPTAELELSDMRAHLLGDEGRGTKQIATVLNIARVHNAMSSMGFWGRGLAVARAFARARKVGLKPLAGKPAHVRTLARLHADYRANVLFTFFVAALLGVVEQPQIAEFNGHACAAATASRALPDPDAAETLLRLLTPAVKGVTAKAAVAGLSECMEALGGVGYLENEEQQFNIARLYRDAGVCSIWEGTTDMMAHDVLRVLYGKTKRSTLSAMDAWVAAVLGSVAREESCGACRHASHAVERWWARFKTLLEECEREEVEMRAREMMGRLGDVVMGVLLLADAARDGDEAAADTARVWIASREDGDEGVVADGGPWHERAARDRRIVFGSIDDEEAAASKL